MTRTSTPGAFRGQAKLCSVNEQYVAAARLYAAAFAARPQWAGNVKAGHGYDAARSAALAAAGQGADAAAPDGPQRARWRRQALGWLRADLAAWAKETDRALVERTLRQWRQAPDLAGVRDREALAQLPAGEREQWQRLWAGVAALLSDEPLKLGRSHAALREWGPAAECYARSMQQRPTDDSHAWFEYAAVLLLSGDREGYRRACAHMVERCGQAPEMRPSFLVARACTLAPDSVADAAAPERLAREELAAGHSWLLIEQAALHYRAGRPQEAVPVLKQSLRRGPRPGQTVLIWLWLALANQRLGKAEEARRWLGQAQALLDPLGDRLPGRAEEELGLHLHNWLEAHALRREAEAVIRPAGPR